MTRLNTLFAAAGCFAVLASTASAQRETPETNVPSLSFDSPATGVDLATITDDREFFDKGRLTVTGTASDDTRIHRIQFRLEGSKRWRNATIIRTGTGDTANDYVWSFRVSVNRRSDRRIYVRAVDPFKNESDIIGRKLIRRR